MIIFDTMDEKQMCLCFFIKKDKFSLWTWMYENTSILCFYKLNYYFINKEENNNLFETIKTKHNIKLSYCTDWEKQQIENAEI